MKKEKTYNTTAKKVGILTDFYLFETKRILLGGMGVALCMLYLFIYAKLPMTIWLIPIAVVLFAMLKMLFVGSLQFRRRVDHMGEFYQQRMQDDFRKPHTVCKLFSGWVHLLPDCLVCHRRGILTLIVLEDVIQMQNIQYSAQKKMARSLILYTDTNKYELEFAGFHQKEIKIVMEWIEKQNPNVEILGGANTAKKEAAEE